MALPAFRLGFVDGGGSPLIREFTVAAAQTFVYGDPVKLTGTNDEIAGSANDDATEALGVALADAVPPSPAPTNVGKLIPVMLFSPNTVFSARTLATVTSDLVGDSFGIDLTSSVYSVEAEATANQQFFTCVGTDTTDSSRILVKCLTVKWQLSGQVFVA